MKVWPANYLDCEQGSPEWLDARKGHVTASRVADIVTKGAKGQYLKKRQDYMDELIAEILTGRATETYVTAEMEFGTENEHIARGAYEAANEVFVDRVGFVLHPSMGRVGASPDGLIGKDGGLEIKVPKTVTHLRWKRAGIVPAEYRPQMLLGMDCCEREYWDFWSFDPRLKPELQSFKATIRRTKEVEAEIANMRDEITQFLEDLANELMSMTDPIAKQLERSIEAKKAFRKVHPTDDELRAELASLEGIIVP